MIILDVVKYIVFLNIYKWLLDNKRWIVKKDLVLKDEFNILIMIYV